MAPGIVQRKVGAAPSPDEPEWKMVERDLRELESIRGARYHVLHVSSRKTVQLVRAAKAQGLQVTAEVRRITCISIVKPSIPTTRHLK